MNTMSFDTRPLAVHMIQRVTHSRPSIVITAPAPEQMGVAYDIVSESNRSSYIEQSANTHSGKVAEFIRR